MSFCYSNDFIHLAVTHGKKYVLHHNPAHTHIYISLKTSCSLNEITYLYYML